MFKITIGQWLPVTCLSINSMLDPFLYAFRHTQFKREIRRKKTRSSNKVFPFLSVSPPVNTTTGDSMAFNSCPLAGRKNIEVGAPRSKTNNQEETSCVNDQTSGWSWIQCHSKQHLHNIHSPIHVRQPSYSIRGPRGRGLALEPKSVDAELKSRSDRKLDLLQIVRGSTSRLPLYIATWSTSCQLGFLTCSVPSVVCPANNVNY